MSIKMDSRLIDMCIEAATQSLDAVESWRRQRRTLDRLPSHLAEALIVRLLRRRLLFPSLLEVFKNTVEKIDLGGESIVDAEWMAYLGGLRYLRSLNVADCHKITSSAIWPLAGMINLKELDLSRCSKFTDAGIRHLLSIPKLEELCISETGVTANGVTLLSSFRELSMLDLGGLHVTDLSLSSLQVLTKLQYLDLWGSEVSNKGVRVLQMYPKLSFLNLAWTKVTKLPILPSLACLNMSNCTIHSMFEGEGDKVCLTKLILTGATIVDVSEAFSYVDTSFLTFLDVSNSSLQMFSFLPDMIALEYLDLSCSPVGDDSVEMIACIGANLKFLNLSNTRVSFAGVRILAGHVPELETLLLSGTPTDDLAISYISTIPSLKIINLSSTHVRGEIQQIGAESESIPSLAALQNLSRLERLEMEETQVTDASLNPLSNLQGLSYLSLSGSLSDISLCCFSSIRNLIHLGVHDAVLTGAGLASFNPPPCLKVLDLTGCWLLTKDAIVSFCQKNPQIEVRHELCHFLPSDQGGLKYSSPKTRQRKTKEKKKETFLDQRLKYTREELLGMQVQSLSFVPRGSNVTTTEQKQ